MSDKKNIPNKDNEVKNLHAGQIKITDNIPGGEYANALQVGHNTDEIQLIFLNLMNQTGRVSGKIITTPGNFKRMIAAMRDNIKKYEDKFGEIKESPEVNKEIGFKE